MEPFKNWLNPKVAEQIAMAIKRNQKSFDQLTFLKNINKELENLELKERVHFLSEKLHAHLPKNQQKATVLLVGALKRNDQDQVGLSGVALWPLTHYISIYGLEYFDQSMEALKEMTKLFTSEFAVRAFFLQDQKRFLKIIKEWMKDDNEHVRRLVSEGLRPLLPWGVKLEAVARDPMITWGILDALKNDPSEYVRKSVANHINDHTKNHPEFVIEKLMQWHLSEKKTKEVDWVIRHGSRSLIKKGYLKSFVFHGVEGQLIEVGQQKILTKKVNLGESLKVRLVVENKSHKIATVILDHEIYLLKKNKSHTIKIFKGKKIKLAANQSCQLELKIPLKAVTTRVYYPGRHYWNVKINGVNQTRLPFELVM